VRRSTEYQWVDPDWHIDMKVNVDREGWEYADNHWEGFSSKSTMGKYTRRRKWVRTARVIETVERIEQPEERSASEEFPSDRMAPSPSNDSHASIRFDSDVLVPYAVPAQPLSPVTTESEHIVGTNGMHEHSNGNASISQAR
jgi:hypothetical protein